MATFDIFYLFHLFLNFLLTHKTELIKYLGEIKKKCVKFSYTYCQNVAIFLIWRLFKLGIFPQVGSQEAVGIANGGESGLNKITQSTS